MARILLVEDEPDLGTYEAFMLEAEGHHVLRCSGGIDPFRACPLLRRGTCSLADAADLILFSVRLYAPLRHRMYNGTHLLKAYRRHPVYGRLPMLVVSVGLPEHLEGTGAIRSIAKYSEPHSVLEAIKELIGGEAQATRATGPERLPKVPAESGRTAGA
jgi:CheY-like chemotaxis protein